MKLKQTIRSIDSHRNGISGVPFQVAIVDEVEDGQRRQMLVVRFEREADKLAGGTLCAAFDMEMLAKGDISSRTNAWRGDYYRDLIDKNRKLTLSERGYREAMRKPRGLAGQGRAALPKPHGKGPTKF